MNNLPPGVTGSEDIFGPQYEKELDDPCPRCGKEESLTEMGWNHGITVVCGFCGHETEREYETEDPDAYEKAVERAEMERDRDYA